MHPDKIKKRSISCEASLVQALKQMDIVESKLLLVFKDDVFYSILSIGDIQRAIIKGVNLSEPVDLILRKNIRLGHEHDSDGDLKELMQKYRMEFLPVLTHNGALKEVLFWDE
ncbi:MAG: Nucleoside-diphosphate-sugar pyrophosphorylase family protein, partial [Segetibacter sp.]|nr:Nucleoside-diphosphate-sugar pyrophosphorylase family protein [Segetibacter sp.]